MKPWLRSHQQIFSNQFSRNILPHAILISGITGSGKFELSQWLIHLLTCQRAVITSPQENVLEACGQCKSCLLLKSKTYPDHLSLVAEKNSLGVDDVRHANTFLQKTAHLGKFKTVLIEHAQTMTQAAANALLKTLEEPSNYSVIILLTNDIEMILPTIVSRCRVLNIRPTVGHALLQSMPTQGLTTALGSESRSELNSNSNSELKNNFINLTQLPELTDASINNDFQQFKTCYIDYLYGQQVEPQLLEYLLKNEHGLRWLEQITVNLYREQLLTVSTPLIRDVLATELLNDLYKVIINGCKVIKSYTQANKQFVYEKLIMSISDVLEKAKINK